MPLFVSLRDDDPGELVNSGNVHRCCQNEMAGLRVVLSNRERDESFSLSYLLGHTTKITRLWLDNGNASTFSNVLLQLERATGCCVEELFVTSTATSTRVNCWDANATKLLNRVCLDNKESLSRLGFGADNIDIAGINLSFLQELRLSMVNESTILNVANSLHEDCRLSSLKITGIHLSKVTPSVLQALCHKLSLLKNLTRLYIVIFNSSPDNLRQFAESLPSSVQSLTICWGGRGQDVQDLSLFKACMPSLLHLDIRFEARQTADIVLNDIMVSLLKETSQLQYLSVGPLRHKRKQPMLPFLQELSSPTITTLRTVVLRFPLNFDTIWGSTNDEAANCIYSLLRQNRNLRDFRYTSTVNESKEFNSRLMHLLRLNQLRFRDKILPGNIPLSVWPRLLEKAANRESVLYELLRQKNDKLIVHGRQ
jgi:hypothetical protein